MLIAVLLPHPPTTAAVEPLQCAPVVCQSLNNYFDPVKHLL
jgi:hypothetical protein